jgi:hypothetical protein
MAATKSLRFPTDMYHLDANGFPGQKGFSISVTQANITSAGVNPATKNAYTAANQPQDDLIEAVSSDAADITQTLTFVGIDANGDRIEESVHLNVADGTTAITTTSKFTYFEFARLDAACVGTITVREGSGNAALTTITIGDLVSQVAHVYAGEHRLFITYFGAAVTSAAGNMTATLYRYPAAVSSVAPTAGLIALDSIAILDGEGISPQPANYWPMAYKIGPGEYCTVGVVGEGGDDEDVTVTIQGIILPFTKCPV